MLEDLFFIARIAEAMMQVDTREALWSTFLEIQASGLRSSPGYAQFRRFIKLAAWYAQEAGQPYGASWSIRELMVDLITGHFEGTPEEQAKILAWIYSWPKWSEQLKLLREPVARVDGLRAAPQFRLFQGGQFAGTLAVREETGKGALVGITPGEYSLLLETGRLIWEGPLTVRQLTWTSAFPNQPLSLAAATGDSMCRPTLETRVLDNQWVLRVYPGMETGRMEITRTRAGI